MLLSRPCIGRITSPFGMRIHPVTGQWSGHQGVDIAPRTQDLSNPTIPIYAPANGTVTRRYADGVFGTYGNCLILRHVINGKTYETLYAHLKSFNVRQGQIVKQGQQIAVMGNTGRSTGRHLHFEVHEGTWNNRYTNARDPMRYITLVPSLGAIGSDVIDLQKKLNEHGYRLTVDGHFGNATDNALKQFQRKFNLTVDGFAGPSTFAELDKSVIKPAAPKPTPPKEEVDEMAQRLPETQRNDMKTLLSKAYKDKVFHVDHTSKIDTMTRGQATDLLISYVARTSK